eukprot:805649-Pyramimonas_sp.AAC.1
MFRTRLKSWLHPPKSSFWESRASLSLVTGDHSANHVPPLRAVHLDSRSVCLVLRPFGHLYWTKLPQGMRRVLYTSIRGLYVSC